LNFRKGEGKMFKMRSITRGSRLFILLLLLLTAGLLGACSPEAAPVSNEEPGEELEYTAENPLKIAAAHVGPITDGGWSQYHHEGILAVLEEYGDRVELVGEVESMPFSEEATRTLEQFVADGAKVIFITSEYADFVYKVAEAHPDVIFEECNGYKWTDNLVYYYFPAAYGEYAEGVAAGLLTESNKIGFIGSFPTLPSNITAYNAFAMGVRSVAPEATIHVVNVNSWFDPPAERQASEALFAEGVDYLHAYVDDPAIIAFAEEKGIWSSLTGIGYEEYGPTTYVGGAIHNFADGYVAEVGMVLDGTWEGNRWWISPFGPGGYTMQEWTDAVPADIKAQLDDIVDSMYSGEFDPFVGPIYDNEGELRFADGEVMTDEYRYRDWTWPVAGIVVSE
jgi:basic membrane protein A and related proteins